MEWRPGSKGQVRVLWQSKRLRLDKREGAYRVGFQGQSIKWSLGGWVKKSYVGVKLSISKSRSSGGSQDWWCISLIPAPGRLRQVDL